MSQPPSTLHMLCGKIASGKSTLAASLANQSGTVRVSEDDWLSILFADQLSTVADYARLSARLRPAMGPHVTALLNAGISVVLDFPANTIENRRWMRGIVDAADASHQLHYLATPDDVCLARLRARNAEGKHAFAASEEQFRLISKHFEPPTPDEGLNIIVHDRAD